MIKINSLGPLNSPTSIKNAATKKTATEKTPVLAENTESSKIEHIKALIQSKQYKVDPDALAKKLYHSLFSSPMDL